MTLRALHLFASIGGSHLTGEILGWPSVGISVEWDEWRRRVLEARYGEKTVKDVRAFEPLRHLRVGQVQVVVGGSPCQDISIMGHLVSERRGIEGERSNLFLRQVEIAAELKSPLIFWENVANTLSVDHGKTWKTIQKTFDESGYNFTWIKIGAQHACSPQPRARIFVLAWRKDADVARLVAPWLNPEPPDDGDGENLLAWAVINTYFRQSRAPRKGWRTSKAVQVGTRAVFPSPSGEQPHSWEPVPMLVRSSSHIERQVEAIGDAWMPQQAATAWHLLCYQAVNWGPTKPDGSTKPVPRLDLPWLNTRYELTPGLKPPVFVRHEGFTLWQTPLSEMHHGAGTKHTPAARKRYERGSLDAQLLFEGDRFWRFDQERYINPDWAALLMGFPDGLLDVE